MGGRRRTFQNILGMKEISLPSSFVSKHDRPTFYPQSFLSVFDTDVGRSVARSVLSPTVVPSLVPIMTAMARALEMPRFLGEPLEGLSLSTTALPVRLH